MTSSPCARSAEHVTYSRTPSGRSTENAFSRRDRCSNGSVTALVSAWAYLTFVVQEGNQVGGYVAGYRWETKWEGVWQDTSGAA